MPFERVASLDQLPVGGHLKALAGGQPLLLSRTEDGVHAVHNTCLHRGGDLSAGEFEGETVICPLHFWRFSVRTGVCEQVPSMQLKTFPVKIENNEVHVEV
jgi:nitrite reductase/ring-hydroxylating ferredoxin subunit